VTGKAKTGAIPIGIAKILNAEVVDTQDLRCQFRAFRDSVILVPDSARAKNTIFYRDPSDPNVLVGADLGVRYRYIRELD
jgi:uncharacterized membrane protein